MNDFVRMIQIKRQAPRFLDINYLSNNAVISFFKEKKRMIRNSNFASYRFVFRWAEFSVNSLFDFPIYVGNLNYGQSLLFSFCIIPFPPKDSFVVINVHNYGVLKR